MSVSQHKHVVILSLLLAAATFAVYNPIVRNHFIDFDDQAYILDNDKIHDGLTWNAVKWSFSTFHEGNWHPLTWMSHALDCQFFGLNPIGHHYTNLLLHVANVVLLFLLLQRASGRTWPSLMVAALFALHPVNVESVAWAAERKNVLSMVFFLLALHAYDRFARTRKTYLYWIVFACFALGLMAKAQIVTLPFILLLWDYWPLQRTSEQITGEPPSPHLVPRSSSYLLWEKMPLFVLATADCVVTVLAQRAGDTIRTLAEVSLPLRIESVFVSYLKYIGKAFWPSRLALMYPRPENQLPAWQWLSAVVLLLLVSAMVLRWRNHRYLVFGWCWFLGTLVPMIGIVTVGEQAMADRYAYLPFIGLFIAVVWIVADLSARAAIGREWLAAVAACVLVICGSLTYRQLSYWRDSETMWRYTLSVTDRNYMAHSNLAIALANEGRSEEAISHFRAAEALHKYPPGQILTLALYESRVGHPEEAIEECKAVLRAGSSGKDSASADPKVQLAAWSGLGRAQLQLHEYAEAAESYENALRLNPQSATALVGAALVALGEEKSADAVADLVHAVTLEPSDVNFLLLAHALRMAGRPGDAELAAAQARRISPNLKASQTAAGQLLSVAGAMPE